MRRLAGPIALVVFLLTTVPFAGAVEPDEILPDPVLETRARLISKELRCLVCQNQSIDDSSAPLARDLRLLVRERLKTGATDQEVLAHVAARYGDFVLLRPPLKASTLVLWVGPWLLLAGVILWFVLRRRTRRQTDPDPLSQDEELRVAAILEPDDSR